MNTAATATAKESGELQAVVFKLGSEIFGVDVHQVREIIKMREYTRIPNTPPYISGVINLRGQITTIIDLRKIFGMDSAEINSDSRIIILDAKDVNVGVIVDSVLGVTRIPLKNVDPPPKITHTSALEFITGIAKQEDNLIILLDLEKLLEKGLKEASVSLSEITTAVTQHAK